MNYSFSNSAGQSNALLYGYSVGLGLDWAVMPNLFLRSEFEFVQFVPLDGITVNIISARVGAGLKF
jgi:outer membrane immunogenic protein